MVARHKWETLYIKQRFRPVDINNTFSILSADLYCRSYCIAARRCEISLRVFFNTKELSDHFTFASKGAICYVTVAIKNCDFFAYMLFHVWIMISRFRLKAHLSVHKYFYNKVYSTSTNDWSNFFSIEAEVNSSKITSRLIPSSLFLKWTFWVIFV